MDASRTRPRGGEKSQNSILAGQSNIRGVEDALLRARRTERWLKTLPMNVERISMANMRAGEDDVLLLAEFLKTRCDIVCIYAYACICTCALGRMMYCC